MKRDIEKGCPLGKKIVETIEATARGEILKGIETITTLDATDADTTKALANELKAKVNELITALQGK